MNWLLILLTAILSMGFSVTMLGDILSKGAVIGVAILMFALMWTFYGIYCVAGA